MATKKASPAQIAARKLFAERAKAGEFAGAKKRKIAVKKNPIKNEPIVYTLRRAGTGNYYFSDGVMTGTINYAKNQGYEILIDQAKGVNDVWFSKTLTGAKARIKSMQSKYGAPPLKNNPRTRQTTQAAPAVKRNPKPRKMKKPPESLSERAKAYAQELKRSGNFSKAVGYYPSAHSADYEIVALFNTQAEAVSAATMYADAHPAYRWFVKGY